MLRASAANIVNRSFRRADRRAAFSLIELLVVIAIIAILIALLMPAVQKVRESSTTLQCKNKLKQMGIALHAYVHDKKAFPPGLVVNPQTNSWCVTTGKTLPPMPDKREYFGWMARILPYLEQKPLYDQIKWDQWPWWQHPLNETSLPIYWCNADPRPDMVINTMDPDMAGTSNYKGDLVALTEYMGVSGIDQLAFNGILYVNSRVTFRMISDGASNTLLVGERPPSVDDVYGWWFAGAGAPPMSIGATDVVLGTNELVNADTSSERDVFRDGSINDPANAHRFHYWSQHRGGSNFLFADGSVHFLAYDVGQTTFNALGTRNGDEILKLVLD
jgi:prepilin-type N-terminal cleavage/methylation domain-containing protein/prepilin-type processing-associated H-X9-DG protein